MKERPTDWGLITETREGWERFCWIVGMKLIALATERVRERGESIAEATNGAIEDVAAGIERDGAPAGLADAFRKQYRADRPNQMRLVADSVQSWRDIEAKHPPGRRRKRPKGAKAE